MITAFSLAKAFSTSHRFWALLERCVSVGALLGLGCVSACRDKPPKPTPVEYVVYYGNSANGDLYVLDADSLAIVDSIPRVGHALSIAVSPAGEWLYVQFGSRPLPPLLKKYDTRSKEMLDSLFDDKMSELTPLDSGRLLLRGAPTCRREMIETNELSVQWIADDSVCAMRGPATGTNVAALVSGESRLRAWDVKTGSFQGEYIARLEGGATLEVLDALLHSDGRRVLVIGWSPTEKAWFLIGDLLTGATLLRHQLVYPQGQIAVSEDGKIAAVSDPSRMGIWDSEPTIDLFDLETVKHIKRFAGSAGGGLEGFPRDVVFIPGTAILLGTPGASGAYSEEIHVIDAHSLAVVRVVRPEFTNPTPTAISIGIRK